MFFFLSFTMASAISLKWKKDKYRKKRKKNTNTQSQQQTIKNIQAKDMNDKNRRLKTLVNHLNWS